jgi:hypothetical protein
LILFRDVYEQTQEDTIRGPDGVELSLWDLEYLYEQLPIVLPSRQYQAIEWFLVQGYKEEEVAEMMGTAPTNPIGVYATAGLKQILRLISEGELSRFRFDKRAVA